MNDGANNTGIWPVLGIVFFVFLYILASCSYPGGSQFDKDAIGFSWFHNYWCNLLNTVAINGKINYARTLALVAHSVLCISLWYFYWFLASSLVPKKQRLYLQIVCTISCFLSLLLMSNLNHDLVANLGALFSVISLLITIHGLWHHQLFGLFYTGLFNFIIVAVNTMLYYHHDLIYYLPFVQKLSLLYYLIWVCCICLLIMIEKKQPKRQY